MNALHLAAKEGHTVVVAELLKHGADINAATNVSICICIYIFYYTSCYSFVSFFLLDNLVKKVLSLFTFVI